MLISLPALNDNYIWLYAKENQPVLIVDLPETTPLFAYLTENQLQPEAVLITHNHNDHIAGIAEFKKTYPNVPIYGPSECAEWVDHIINEGQFHTAHYQIEVFPSGGHTANHISYVVDNHLFCGDTLFSAGCGRVFTQDYAQMFASVQRLNQLPADTLLCGGHEYTLSNLAFAKSVLSDKSAVNNHLVLVKKLRSEGKASMPTKLALERQINPFLQAETLAQFIALRKAKDNF